MKSACLLLFVLQSMLWATPELASRSETSNDKIAIEEGVVTVVPEYWNPYRGSKCNKPNDAVLWTGTRRCFKRYLPLEQQIIGHMGSDDLYLYTSEYSRVNIRGLRDELLKTYTAGWGLERRRLYLLEMLQTRLVPFEIQQDSEHIGIFFDGTGSFAAQTMTNIYRDYRQYAGSRFYFPGVGNFTENNVYGIIAGATWADMQQQFMPAIRQAYREIQRVSGLTGSKTLQVDCFGMSRGAAQCIELARMLEMYPIPNVTVNFLALYEPVYSLGFLSPGQNSDLVESGNINENWTRVKMPSNVRQAAVLYGRHEERTWFSAAFLAYDKNKTMVDIGILSGAHGSICGPRVESVFQRSLHIMARGWMAERAQMAGVPRVNNDVLPSVLNEACAQLMTAYASYFELSYDDFGAGAIQGQQGVNLQWLAYRLLPWRWGGDAPVMNRYQRNFAQLEKADFSENVLY